MKKNVLIIGNCNIYGGVGHMIKEYCERLYSDKIHFDILYMVIVKEKLKNI